MISSERELKYSHDAHSADRVLRSLERLCRADGEYCYNKVSSIYFDTADWLLAMEKASSDYLKTKVRLRWYQTPGDDQCSPCFLEIKRKIGSTRNKIRVPLQFTGNDVYDHLASPELHQQIRQALLEHAPELCGFEMIPQIQVSYLRHRYVEPFSNSRIALDSNIQASPIVQRQTLHTKSVLLDTSVLEVKGRHEDLPTLLRQLNASNFKKAAFSKYYECFVLLTDYRQ